MVSRANLIGLAVVTLLSAIVLYQYFRHGGVGLTGTKQPAHYWCTVVGVEEDMTADQVRARLLPALLHGTRLLAVRQLSTSSPFSRALELALPSHLKSILVALYSSDPHLNWRQAHLLHQGPLSKDVINLALPTLVCPSRLPIHHAFSPLSPLEGLLDEEDTVAILKPSLSSSNRTSIIDLLRDNNFTILSTWSLTLTNEQIDRFYEEHRERSFFPSLQQHMLSGPSLVLVVRGTNAVARLRSLVGATDPAQAAPGTIRSLYGIDKTANAIHASDSSASVVRELSILCQGKG